MTPGPSIPPPPPRRHPVRPTTWIEPEKLREALGIRVTLVAETFQRTGSFKFRAAWNRARGSGADHLVAASSGNFGQALACACRLLGKRATIVMPQTSAQVKVDAVRSHGATVELTDVRVEPREAVVERILAADPEAEAASAYDDPLVIAGNATLGVEIGERLREWPAERRDRAVVVVPVGGGGISAGIALGLEAAGFPNAPVLGAEPLLGYDAARSLRAGRRIGLERESSTIADGARVAMIGAWNWAVISERLDGIVEVPEESIATGVRRLFGEANLKAEPTGALGVGAVLTDPDRFRDREVLCVVTGGNVDPAVYADLLADG